MGEDYERENAKEWDLFYKEKPKPKSPPAKVVPKASPSKPKVSFVTIKPPSS